MIEINQGTPPADSCRQLAAQCWKHLALWVLGTWHIQSHKLRVYPMKYSHGFVVLCLVWLYPLQWRHNGRDGVSNHQPHECLLNRLFRRRSKETSKFRVTGLCVGNSVVTGEFPAQMASNAENVSIWWRHYAIWEDPHGLFIACPSRPLHWHWSNRLIVPVLVKKPWRKWVNMIDIELQLNTTERQWCIFIRISDINTSSNRFIFRKKYLNPMQFLLLSRAIF